MLNCLNQFLVPSPNISKMLLKSKTLNSLSFLHKISALSNIGKMVFTPIIGSEINKPSREKKRSACWKSKGEWRDTILTPSKFYHIDCALNTVFDTPLAWNQTLCVCSILSGLLPMVHKYRYEELELEEFRPWDYFGYNSYWQCLKVSMVLN